MGTPPTPLSPFSQGGTDNGGGRRQNRDFSRMIKNKKVGDGMAGKKPPSRAKILNSLMKQLEAKGAKVAHFEDLIYDYLFLYDTKIMLQKDIKDRGVAYETTSANGFKITKQNQSVKDLVAIEKQMSGLLKELGLTTDEPTGEESADEDL